MNTPVVLITGALTGIGRATAVAFAHEGARIVVSGRRDEVGQMVAAVEVFRGNAVEMDRLRRAREEDAARAAAERKADLGTLAERLELTQTELDRIAALVQSQLEVSLSQLLPSKID